MPDQVLFPANRLSPNRALSAPCIRCEAVAAAHTVEEAGAIDYLGGVSRAVFAAGRGR